MIDFAAAFNHLLRWEGGYVNDPDDLGGETKYGITKRRYPRLDIRNLTIEEARAIYRRDFFDALKLGLLPERLQYIMFDGCVNQGPAWTIRALQRRAGVRQDGKIGPITARASREVLPVSLLAIREERYRYIAGFRNNAKFLRGWLNRLDSTAKVTYAGFEEVTRGADGRTPSCWRPGRVV